MKITSPINGIVISKIQKPQLEDVHSHYRDVATLALAGNKPVITAPISGTISEISHFKDEIIIDHGNGMKIAIKISNHSDKKVAKSIKLKVKSGGFIMAGQPLMEINGIKLSNQYPEDLFISVGVTEDCKNEHATFIPRMDRVVDRGELLMEIPDLQPLEHDGRVLEG